VNPNTGQRFTIKRPDFPRISPTNTDIGKAKIPSWIRINPNQPLPVRNPSAWWRIKFVTGQVLRLYRAFHPADFILLIDPVTLEKLRRGEDPYGPLRPPGVLN
jgi:hypothetical protein